MAVLTELLDSDQVTAYIKAAHAAGCPRDQIENFIRAGVILQDKQLLASAAARQCDHPDGPTDVGYGGARGGGKSHWGLAQVAADDCQRVPGLKCLVLRKVGKSNKENFDDLRIKILSGLTYDWKGRDGILTFENGSRIILGHYQNERDIDAYLGLEYDIILIEEATTLSPSKLRAIATCCRTSRRDWRPRMYYTTNPGGVGHAHFKKKFVLPWRTGKQTDTRFVPATVYDNRFVNIDYRKRLEALVGWEKEAWLYGDWDIAAGQFFTNFVEEVHVIKPFEIPKNWPMWLSMDYGFTHYTSSHLLTQGDGTLFCVDEYGARKRHPESHAREIIAMVNRQERSMADLRWKVIGPDAFTKKEGKSMADTYKALGICLQMADADRIQGAGEIMRLLGDPHEQMMHPDGSDLYDSLMPRVFIFNRCVKLIEQIPSMVHDPNRPEDVDKVDCDEDGEGGDDFYDDFRYGIMASVKPPRPTWEVN